MHLLLQHLHSTSELSLLKETNWSRIGAFSLGTVLCLSREILRKLQQALVCPESMLVWVVMQAQHMADSGRLQNVYLQGFRVCNCRAGGTS
jgi:hypothetical protein